MPDASRIEIGSFDATAQNVTLPVGLTLDYVRLEALDASLRIDEVGLGLKRPAAVEVGIGESSLQTFLNAKAPGGLEDFRARIAGGKVMVDAVKRVLVPLPARAICSLRVDDGTRIYVEVEEVQMLGAGVKDMVQGQIDKLNPIVDLSQFPVNLQVTELEAEDGKIVLRGVARI